MHVRLPKGKMEALHPCSQSAGWIMTLSKVLVSSSMMIGGKVKWNPEGGEIPNIQIIVSVELEHGVCFHQALQSTHTSVKLKRRYRYCKGLRFGKRNCGTVGQGVPVI